MTVTLADLEEKCAPRAARTRDRLDPSGFAERRGCAIFRRLVASGIVPRIVRRGHNEANAG